MSARVRAQKETPPGETSTPCRRLHHSQRPAQARRSSISDALSPTEGTLDKTEPQPTRRPPHGCLRNLTNAVCTSAISTPSRTVGTNRRAQPHGPAERRVQAAAATPMPSARLLVTRTNLPTCSRRAPFASGMSRRFTVHSSSAGPAVTAVALAAVAAVAMTTVVPRSRFNTAVHSAAQRHQQSNLYLRASW